MSELERFVTQLQQHGVQFWIEGDRLRWYSVAALRLSQVIAINKNAGAIIEIIRVEREGRTDGEAA